MPRYDLAGNPLPDDDQPKYGQPGGPTPPAYGGQPPRFDLAGNPIAPAAPPQNPTLGAPQGARGPAPYAPPGPGGYVPPPAAYPPPGGGYTPPGPAAYTPPGGGYAPPPGGTYPPPGGYGGAQPGAPGQFRSNGYVQPVVSATEGGSKNIITFGIIAGIVVIGLAAFGVANMPHALPPTSSYTPYVDAYRQFNCDQPQGWDAISAEQINSQDADPGVDVGGVLFKKFGAKIDITTGTVGTLTGNLLMAPGDGTQALGSKLPEMDKENYGKVKNGFSQYTELSSNDIGTNFGESKEYEFTAAGPRFGIPSATHGYVVEMVGSTHTVLLVATAPVSDWAVAKPIFDHVISTVGEGGTPGQAPAATPAGGGGGLIPGGIPRSGGMGGP